jgi:multidrug resistance efflux pump
MSHTVLERAAVPVRATHDLRRQARRLAPAGLAFLLALGAAAYGHHWWTVGRFIESTDDAYVGGEVTVIAPKVSGLIAQVLVTDNQTVRAGDLLVKIDDRDYRAALDKATGAVEAERAALANLDATRRLQEAMIAQAEAEVAAAEPRSPAPASMSFATAISPPTSSPRRSASSRPMRTPRRRSPAPGRRRRRWPPLSAGSTSSTPRSSRRRRR